MNNRTLMTAITTTTAGVDASLAVESVWQPINKILTVDRNIEPMHACFFLIRMAHFNVAVCNNKISLRSLKEAGSILFSFDSYAGFLHGNEAVGNRISFYFPLQNL